MKKRRLLVGILIMILCAVLANAVVTAGAIGTKSVVWKKDTWVQYNYYGEIIDAGVDEYYITVPAHYVIIDRKEETTVTGGYRVHTLNYYTWGDESDF